MCIAVQLVYGRFARTFREKFRLVIYAMCTAAVDVIEMSGFGVLLIVYTVLKIAR